MYATNVRNLKKNPSLALRKAEESPVLVLKGNEPNAVILHLDGSLTDTEQAFRPAVAADLYQDGVLSLGGSAKLSGLPLTDFIEHLSNLGIEIVRVDETTKSEVKDISSWLAS